MRTNNNDKIMNNEIEMPEPPEGYKWNRVAYNKTFNSHYMEGCEVVVTYKPVKIQTHREDGTPLYIDPLPDMPDNVERVEYFGRRLRHKSMGDADNYIAFKDGWIGILKGHDDEDDRFIDRDPNGCNLHYARVWYKKPKTQLSDLIGEGGQTNAYLIWSDGSWTKFRPCSTELVGGFTDKNLNITNSNIRWSHSPFTSYEDANKFNF